MKPFPGVDPIEVSDELVTVRKAVLDLGREGVAGVRLTIGTDAVLPVAVQLVEQLPATVSMGDVEVHPRYGRSKWSIDDPSREMVFEDVIPPGGEVVTLYGVRTAEEGVEPFLGEPLIARTQLADADAEGLMGVPTFRGAVGSTSGDSSDSGPSPSSESGPSPSSESGPSPSSESGPTVEPDDTDADDGSPADESDGEPAAPASGEASTRDEPFQYGEERSSGSTSTPPGGPEGDAPTALDPADVVRTLVDELSSESLSEAQRSALRDALGLEPLSGLRAQLDDLQSSVAGLSAGDVASDDAVSRLVDDVGSLSSAVDDLGGQLDGLETELAALRQAHDAGVERLSDRLEALETASDPDDDLAAARDVVEAERSWRERFLEPESPPVEPAVLCDELD